jgi:hypothetical protein
MAREVLDMQPITIPKSSSPQPPQLVIDLTEWIDSDSLASNETAIANTVIEPVTNDAHANETNQQQLLDFLMNQLRPYGIVDPNSITSTTIPPSTSTSLSNVAEVMNKLSSMDIDKIVNPQQMQFLHEYVMHQLKPLGILNSNGKPAVSTTAKPSTTTASVTKSNLMNIPHDLDVKTLLAILRALETNKEKSNVIAAK